MDANNAVNLTGPQRYGFVCQPAHAAAGSTLRSRFMPQPQHGLHQQTVPLTWRHITSSSSGSSSKAVDTRCITTLQHIRSVQLYGAQQMRRNLLRGTRCSQDEAPVKEGSAAHMLFSVAIINSIPRASFILQLHSACCDTNGPTLCHV